MPSPFRKPRLPSHYYVWAEPPDSSGDESLHFVSERRSVKLKGHSFREFQQLVVPLLDGRHLLVDIQQAVQGRFRPEDVLECLQLLEAQNLIEEGDNGLGEEATRRLMPQLNFFHEATGRTEWAHRRLADATVTIIGLAGAGPGAALSLAAAGVGTLRCVDALRVQPADVYLSSVFQLKDVGENRAQAIRQAIEGRALQVKVEAADLPMDSEDEVRRAIEGSDFVVCCLDAGQSNLAFKLNRACLAAGIRWTSCALAGAEVIIGPTVHPFEGPCYLCYRMRAVACSPNPEDAFAFERHLDRRKQDDSSRRENLVFGAGIAANLLGLEALKELTGFAVPSAIGRICVLNLSDLTLSRHVILRKPWCPACFRPAPDEQPKLPAEALAGQGNHAH